MLKRIALVVTLLAALAACSGSATQAPNGGGGLSTPSTESQMPLETPLAS